MDTNDQPITRKDLAEALQVFGRELLHGLNTEFRPSLLAEFREDLDAKLATTENRITKNLMDHTEETVGRYNAELLENIAEIIQPMQSKLNNHEKRLKKLEHQAA